MACHGLRTGKVSQLENDNEMSNKCVPLKVRIVTKHAIIDEVFLSLSNETICC